MCRSEVDSRGGVAVGSGGSRSTRLRNQARLHFRRYNYVIYQNLGANLEDGFLSFLSGILGGQNDDFYYVDESTPDNLNLLFNVSNRRQIPSQYRPYESSAYGRWIYLFASDSRRGDKIYEIDYRDANDWDATEFAWPRSGSIQPVRAFSADGYFTLDRALISNTYALALPIQIQPETAANLFTGSFFNSARNFIRLEVAAPAGGVSSYDYDAYIFDPAQIVSHSAGIIEYHTHLMKVVDAREHFSRLSRFEGRIRKRGILACMCKQLVDNESSLQDDANRSRLNSAFNRFANYGHRKAKFIDNLYNFFSHDILTDLERGLMEYTDNNTRPDGAAWLAIIAPMAGIAGEHILLANFLNDAADQPGDRSAWATFFKVSRQRGTASERASSNAWSRILGTQDYLKLALGVAESRAYYLIDEHTAGRINWQRFNELLGEDQAALRQLPPGMRRTGAVIRGMRKINTTMSWASRLGRLKGVFDGEITTSTFTSALDSLSDLAKSRGATGIALKACVIKNMIDVVSHTSDFVNRIGVDDYDAAFGHGLVIAAGLTEAGYLVATGSALGGPVGAVVGIVGAVGAIIVVLATDSDLELFIQYGIWGSDPRGSTGQPDWAVQPFNRWNDDDNGIETMLNSLINLLYKFDVRHNYDTTVHVIAIEIDMKTLPDSAVFVFRGEFANASGTQGRISFEFSFPSRRRRRYTTITSRQSGTSYVRGVNTQVVTESGKHTIKLNLGTQHSPTTGQAWIQCLPFGHSEFTVPHGGRAFHLEQLIEHDAIIINRWRDYSFESDEWGRMPSWT
jgi:hypothetical protein